MKHRGTEGTEKTRVDEASLRDPLSEKVVGAAIEVHKLFLGLGLLESAYTECLAHELSQRGIKFSRELEIPVRYKNVLLDCGYRLDFMMEDTLVLELKAVEKLKRCMTRSCSRISGFWGNEPA